MSCRYRKTETPQPPIRMLLGSYFRDASLNYQLRYFTADNDTDMLASVTLKTEFNQICHPIMTQDMVTIANKLIQSNTHKEESKSSYRSTYLDERARKCWDERPLDFCRIALFSDGAFTDWDRVFTDEGDYNQEFLGTLPDISEHAAGPVKMCQLRAKFQSQDEKSICLPIDAEEMFHALAAAHDHGILLKYHPPQKIGAQGRLSYSQPLPARPQSRRSFTFNG